MKIIANVILLGAIFISTIGFSQVGINTQNPRATLQIDAVNPKNPESSAGILIPRVEKNPATGNEKGQLIYNVTDSTFYYWDGTKWLPIGRGTNNSLSALFVDSRASAAVTISNNSPETLVPGVMKEFTIEKTKPVQFYSTVNFAGTSSAFVPLFKLKLTKLSDNSVEYIDQASNTFLSDGISKYYGNLPLMTIKNLDAGNYKVEVVAHYNNCCSFDFNYSVGGSDTPVSILIQH